MSTKNEFAFIDGAISEPRRSRHKPNRVNPRVGALVVRGNRELDRAFHGGRYLGGHAGCTA